MNNSCLSTARSRGGAQRAQQMNHSLWKCCFSRPFVISRALSHEGAKCSDYICEARVISACWTHLIFIHTMESFLCGVELISLYFKNYLCLSHVYPPSERYFVFEGAAEGKPTSSFDIEFAFKHIFWNAALSFLKSVEFHGVLQIMVFPSLLISAHKQVLNCSQWEREELKHLPAFAFSSSSR